MPALKPTDFTAVVRWLGVVPVGGAGIASAPLERLELAFDGPVGERHSGLTRAACSRVRSQHPKGTEIANVRQMSVVSAEETAAIAQDMGLDQIDPVWLGATLVIEGIPDFTLVPPSSRLQGPDGVTLVVDMENRPCQFPAQEIDRAHPGKGKAFKSAAHNRRGVTAWVERPGTLTLGCEMRLHVPDQPAWPHLAQSRA